MLKRFAALSIGLIDVVEVSDGLLCLTATKTNGLYLIDDLIKPKRQKQKKIKNTKQLVEEDTDMPDAPPLAENRSNPVEALAVSTRRIARAPEPDVFAQPRQTTHVQRLALSLRHISSAMHLVSAGELVRGLHRRIIVILDHNDVWNFQLS